MPPTYSPAPDHYDRAPFNRAQGGLQAPPRPPSLGASLLTTRLGDFGIPSMRHDFKLDVSLRWFSCRRTLPNTVSECTSDLTPVATTSRFAGAAA
jgi:hypothetical protein